MGSVGEEKKQRSGTEKQKEERHVKIVLTQVKKELSSETKNNLTSPIFVCSFSPQFPWPPRASDAHIVRHFSRRLAASETLSLGEEKGIRHETPAQRRGDSKSPAARLTNPTRCQMGVGAPNLTFLIPGDALTLNAKRDADRPVFGTHRPLFHLPVLMLTSHHHESSIPESNCY